MPTQKNTTAIGLMGASGRMGKMILKSLAAFPDARLTCAFVPAWSDAIGRDVGELIGQSAFGVQACALNASADAPQALIDFSLPTAFEETLAYCLDRRVALVMGVTGLSAEQEQKLKDASAKIAIVYAGNYSTGVNLTLNLLATAARALGDAADVEIIEQHHKHKIDAPSGTALTMAKTVNQARHNNAAFSNGRAGQAKRKANEIGIHAVRGGEIVGEHTVKFILDNEIVEITHKAQDRSAFADGAVRAALWLVDKPAGLYDMQDVLDLKRV